MKSSVWRVRGNVVTDAGVAVANAEVEVWCGQVHTLVGSPKARERLRTSWQETRDVRVGIGTTNARGGYCVDFNELVLGDLKTDLGPAFFFKVFSDQGALLYVTEEEFVGTATRDTWTRNIIVPSQPVTEKALSWVIGHCAPHARGTSQRNVQIRLVQKTLGGETIIASTDTMTIPVVYLLSYDRAQFTADKIDLYVRAYADRVLIAESELIVNAPKRLQVDLYVKETDTSEVPEADEVQDILTPLLIGVPDLTVLTDDDFAFLARSTGLSVFQVKCAIKAAIIHDQTTNAQFPVSLKLLYGWLRQSLPMDLHSLASCERISLSNAYGAALNENVIGEIADLSLQIDNLVAAFSALAAEDTAVRGHCLELINHLSLTTTQKRVQLQKQVEVARDPETYWKKLKEDPAFSSNPGLVDNLELAFSASPIVLNQAQLAKALVNPSLTRQQNLDAMLAKTKSDWESFIAAHGGRPSDIDSDSTYANLILDNLEKTYSSPLFASRVKASGESVLITIKDYLLTSDYILEDTKYDLGTLPMKKYLNEVSPPPDENQKSAMFGLQSLYRIAPVKKRFEIVEKIWGPNSTVGLRSALAVSRLGFAAFVDKHKSDIMSILGVTESEATTLLVQIRKAAASAVCTSIMLGTAAFSESILGNTRFFSGTSEGGESGEIPDLETLFGCQDNFEVEHCKSVLGPAAYLVDCFEYLKRTSGTGGQNGYKVLADRRPDLFGIKLSCVNTETTMPYIDLVNEIFESKISGTTEVYQTTKTADELRAEPEHTNYNLYNNELRDLVYPWTFDLAREEAADYLADKGIVRADLMTIFQAGASPSPTDQQINCERIGVVNEDLAVLTTDTHALSELYGLDLLDPEPPTEALMAVTTMLRQALLTYDELLALLDSDFLNFISAEINYCVDPDDPAGLDNAEIGYYSPDGTTWNHFSSEDWNQFLRHLHRYRLLLRKTGWTIEQLDRVFALFDITTPLNTDKCGDAIDDIAAIKRLEKRHGFELQDLLDWWEGEESFPDALETLKVEDEETYDLWKTVLGISDPPTPAETEEFANKLRSFAACELSADTAAYLTKTTSAELQADYPTETALSAFAKELYLGITEAKESSEGIHDPVLDPNNEAGAKTYICDAFAEKLSISPEIMRTLLQKYLYVTTETSKLLDWLIIPKHIWYNPEDHLPTPPSPEPHIEDAFVAVFKNLHRIGALASAFDLNDDMIAFFDTKFTQNAIDEDSVSFSTDNLFEMSRVQELIAKTFSNDSRLYGVLDKPDSVEIRVLLADMTGWEIDDINGLLGNISAFPFTYEVGILEKLKDGYSAYSSLKKAAVSPGQIATWCVYRVAYDPDSLVDIAKEIRTAVAATYPTASWLRHAPDLRDPLRKAQRDLLQTYMIAHGADQEIASIAELFTYYLVDSEMEPLNLTSRLRLAITSVQLLIQRSILGLEGDHIIYDDELADEWKWRKNYRLWEANRKVFLYPENWIEPDLRDDKTPFFQEFEDELLQNEVIAENDEAAYLSYLQKLDDISKLKIRALCKEYDRNVDSPAPMRAVNRKSRYFNYDHQDEYKLHAFGRTKSKPNIYYYRCMENSLWTPWTKIDLDIQSDHLLALVYNRRLYIFWPTFNHVYDKDDGNYVRTEIKMSWSIYQKGIWTPPRTSDTTVTNEKLMERGLDHTGSKSRYLFKAYIDPDTNELYIITVFSQNSLLKKPMSQIMAAGQPDSDMDSLDKLHESLHEYGDNVLTVFVAGGFVMDGCTGTLEEWSGTTASVANTLPLFITTPTNGFVCGMAFDENDPPVGTATPVSTSVGSLTNQPSAMPGSFSSGPGYSPSPTDTYHQYHWDVGPGDGHGCGFGGFWEEQKNKHEEDEANSVLLPTWDGFEHPKEKVHNALQIIEKEGNGNFLVQDDYIASFLSPYNFRLQKVLNNTPRKFRIVPTQQDAFFVGESPFAYEDSKRAFVVIPEDWYATVGLADNRIAEISGMSKFSALDRPGLTTVFTTNSITRARRSGFKCIRPGTERKVTPSVKFNQLYHSPGLATISEPISKALGTTLVHPSMDLVASVFPSNKILPVFWAGKKYTFQPMYHPFTCVFIKQLNRYGIDGLLRPGNGAAGDVLDKFLVRQGAVTHHEDLNYFLAEYMPDTVRVKPEYPKEEIDFSLTGPYSTYNWELFFHIPLMIAVQLSNNGKYEDAMQWFHYIFDPTSTDLAAPGRYWKTKPFYEHAGVIGKGIQALVDDVDNIELLLKEWRENPFNPHLIARFRRIAYMKNVVMKYLDNLLNWADSLFRQDTMEAIDEATQLYTLASQILGRRPVLIRAGEAADLSYEELTAPAAIGRKAAIGDTISIPDGDLGGDVYLLNSMLYFGGVPQNENLLAYWDTVEDRLFKIHNSMNIEGVVRQLALFAPPIDPALLVRAAAAGLDFSAVISAMAGSSPYRFRTLLQKAVEFTNDLKSIGTSLLSALEKKDAEEIALVRADNETALFEAMKQMKEDAIDEAEATLASLEKSLEGAQKRLSHYQDLLDAGLIGKEETQGKQLKSAQDKQGKAGIAQMISSICFAIPDFSAGLAAAITTGGQSAGQVASAFSAGYQRDSAKASYEGNKAGIEAGYERRIQDWKLQRNNATKEIEQIEQQIVAAEIRVAISERDLSNLEKQIADAKEVEDLLKYKYTNKQLYTWMIGKIAGVYFQGYQMAYDLAQRALAAYQREIPVADLKQYIKFDNWDGMRKGLLAGERLHNDLKRLEMAYLQKNEREQEISKSISLAMLNPGQLLALRASGICEFTIPKWFVDMDYPGQSTRRIKTVSLTIPCVAGPNTCISAKLTLLSSPGGQITASSAINDSGMFELNFNDERYFPFELVNLNESHWKIDLPSAVRQFDYATISDVILHIKYTTGSGSSDALGTCSMMVTLGDDFADELQKLRDGDAATVAISRTLFPYFAQQKSISITGCEIVLQGDDTLGTSPAILVQGTSVALITFHDNPLWKMATWPPSPPPLPSVGGTVTLQADSSLTAENIRNAFIVLTYTVTV